MYLYILTYLYNTHHKQTIHHTAQIWKYISTPEVILRHVNKRSSICHSDKTQDFSSISIIYSGPYSGLIKDIYWLPWWLRWWRICLQFGRPEFDPWVRKIPWRREWLPTPVFLPGEFHGQKSLEGYSPCGHKELDMTEWFGFALHRCDQWEGTLL